jgi:predicted GIY-YIG superfamily endonuclease
MGKHRTHACLDGFTTKYGCNMPVYYCGFTRIEEAIAEKSASREVAVKLS